MIPRLPRVVFFFFNDTATTEIYTLSLHDALPISWTRRLLKTPIPLHQVSLRLEGSSRARSEEHTSELLSRLHLVCRLLLEKKKKRQLTCMHNARPSARMCRPHLSRPPVSCAALRR